MATAALACVLVVLASFSVIASRATNTRARAAAFAEVLNESFQRAHFAVASEESLERKYRLEPSAEVRARYLRAGDDLLASLGKIERAGDPAMAGLARRARDVYTPYRAATEKLFAAVDARDTERVLAIDEHEGEPKFAELEDLVVNGAATQQVKVSDRIADLRRTSRLLTILTPIVFLIGFVMLAVFILVLRSYRRQIRRRALVDPLTGMATRAVLLDAANDAIVAARRRGRQSAVAVFDVDHFNEINDTLGHHCGDEVIREIGRRLRTQVGSDDLVVHCGGAEFGVLFVDVADAADARCRAQTIHDAMNAPLTIADLEFTVEMSGGLALGPGHTDSAAHLLRNADVAMHAAKTDHLKLAVYDPESDRHTPVKLALLGDLRRAIENDELALFYQPKLSMLTDCVVGVEALLRWTHPTRGNIPPDEFIPLAERTSIIGPLTTWVIATAAAQSRRWLDQGVGLPIAVNVSAHSLMDPTFASQVHRLLSAAGIGGDAIEIEVTETAIMNDPDRARTVLNELAALGVRLSIDDFGTGYSSLAYLRTLPVHALKIDRSFISHLAANSGDELIVRSVIELAHNLGLDVVAEGVETQHSVDQLRRLGCEQGQGWLWSRAVPPDQLLSWYEARTNERESATLA